MKMCFSYTYFFLPKIQTANSFSAENVCMSTYFETRQKGTLCVNLMSYSFPLQNHQAKSILLWAMEHGGPPEKWAATQCLALSGVITDKVIVELVNHLHTDDAVRTEKAGTLLAQLSQQSVSFHVISNHYFAVSYH